MTTQVTENTIRIPKVFIQRKQGIAILPLEEYEKIKEDLEMFQSKTLAKDIEKARKEIKEGKVIRLKDVEDRLNL